MADPEIGRRYAAFVKRSKQEADADKPRTKAYDVGAIVRHPRYGDGTITHGGRRDYDIVRVWFYEHGAKEFLLSGARGKLEVL